MRPTELHDYKTALAEFICACQDHGWSIGDNFAVSINGWIKIRLDAKPVDAAEDPIISRLSLVVMWDRQAHDILKNLTHASVDMASAAKIEDCMSEWQDRHVAWPGKLSAAQKRIVNLLRYGHEITYGPYWRSGRRTYCNGVKLSDATMTKLREFGVLYGSRLVRLPDPDPVQ